MSVAHEDIPANAPRPGETFAGKYRIERVLGVGGMGYVLAAVHLHLNERVAIKMLLPALAQDKQLVERFLREARAATKIRSEHVVRVLDVGELADRTPYMVMEYLDGADLSQTLDRHGPMPPHLAVGYVLQACEALAEAHQHGMVHRDLKPANLFLSRRADGSACVKVLDFGISKMNNEPGLAMTKTAAMLGSPLYMSPEQLRNAREVDARTDIWAIGVILFELMSGRPPFDAESLVELGAKVLSQDPPWLSTLAPGAPEGLAAVVNTCLRRNLSERFGSLSDFADAAAAFGDDNARRSAARIVNVLGFPSVRTPLASARAPVSTPEPSWSARTLAAPSSGSFGSLAESAAVAHSSTLHATKSSGSGRGVGAAILATVGVGILVAGGLALKGRFLATKAPPDLPSAMATATPPPSAPAVSVAEVATAAPSASASAAPTPSAKPAIAAKPIGRPKPGPTSVPAPTPNAAPTPSPTRANPSGIATSSKD